MPLTDSKKSAALKKRFIKIPPNLFIHHLADSGRQNGRYPVRKEKMPFNQNEPGILVERHLVSGYYSDV